MSSNQRDQLKKAFVEGLGISQEENFEGLKYSEHANWDSVAHMQLVAAIENQFDIMLDTDDVIGMSSFPVACDILKKYGIAAHA